MKKANELINKTTLYAPHTDYTALIEQIHNYVKLSYLPIQFALFTSKKDVFEYFDNRVVGEFKITKEHSDNDIYIGELSRKYGRENDKEVSGNFLLFKHDKRDIYIILTHEDSNFFKNGLLRYIQINYPAFTPPFYYSWEIETLLDHLAESSTGATIMLTKVSRKSRLAGGLSRKSKESDLTWTDLPYKEIFRKAKEDDAWVEKIYFDFIPGIEANKNLERSIILRGFVSRDGIYKCEKNFRLFYEAIVENSIEIFFERKEKLSNRARVKETNYESKPFFIEFEEPIFHDKTHNKRLIGVLRNLTHSANSVIHDNPYVHATVTDYIDNSNYEIWVLSDNRITIVPQAICTMSSLNRFCYHLSKEFQEGRIKDMEEVI